MKSEYRGSIHQRQKELMTRWYGRLETAQDAVAMMISGIALVRSMDTSQLVAGNLAARNATINSADGAIQLAVAWLQTQGNTVTLADCDNQQSSSIWTREAAEGATASSSMISAPTGESQKVTGRIMAMVVSGPIPGTCMRRSQASSACASVRIS